MLDKEVLDAICTGLRLGLPRREACARIGLPVSSLGSWLSTGRRAREYRDGVSDREVAAGDLRNLLDRPRELSEKQQHYVDLVEAVEQAEAEYITSALTTIRRAGQPTKIAAVDKKGRPVVDPKTGQPLKVVIKAGDWKAEAWSLERRRPREFGKRVEQVTRLTGVDDSTPIRMAAEDISGATVEELREMRERVEELRRLKTIQKAAKPVIGEA